MMTPLPATRPFASRQRGAATWLQTIILTAVLVAGIVFVIAYQNHQYRNRGHRIELYHQRLRLPDPEYLRVTSLGFHNFYMDLMFLRSIQMFGAGWIKPNESREPVMDYFLKVSAIDPQFLPIYRFGLLVVGDHGREPELGLKIIDEGMYNNPTKWEMPYLGIFTAIWSLDDLDRARFYIRMAKRIATTPEFVRRMEEFVERRNGRFETAFDMNVDYLLRYRTSGNESEYRLIYNRVIAVLEAWNMRLIHEGIQRFEQANGRLPRQMEEMLGEQYLPTMQLPTLERMRGALELAQSTGRPLDEMVGIARAQSRTTVEGLPPEPRGTWYYLSTERLEDLLERDDVFTTSTLAERYAYVMTPGEAFYAMDLYAFRSQEIILGYMAANNGEKPLHAYPELARRLWRDPIGGHWMYDRENNIFLSTAIRRINEKREPRMGATGRGPFPLPLEPTLLDYEEDRVWARENGLIDARGNLNLNVQRPDPTALPLAYGS